MKTVRVKGMHCTSCETLIKEALEEIGASSVKADWKKGIVSYDGNIPEKKIKDTIKKEGYMPQ